ncbi:MAG TPA: hypothetical protein VMS25_01255, partial [Candidatus Limnocylindrales bacterium]|nr:hypothetical protein [Candidatus Limnocylindrales bacterium]
RDPTVKTRAVSITRKVLWATSTCNIEIDTIDRELRILQLEFTLGRTRADSSAGKPWLYAG